MNETIQNLTKTPRAPPYLTTLSRHLLISILEYLSPFDLRKCHNINHRVNVMITQDEIMLKIQDRVFSQVLRIGRESDQHRIREIFFRASLSESASVESHNYLH